LHNKQGSENPKSFGFGFFVGRITLSTIESPKKGVAMNNSDRRIKGLGEVSIRVRDLDPMHKFYEEVVGLEVLRRDESFVFFKVAEGYGGHTQNLALFDSSNGGFLEAKSEQLSPAETTLHHIALNISLEDFESEKIRLEGLGLMVNATVHSGYMFARCTSPTQREICWSLSVTMQAWDRGPEFFALILP